MARYSQFFFAPLNQNIKYKMAYKEYFNFLDLNQQKFSQQKFFSSNNELPNKGIHFTQA